MSVIQNYFMVLIIFDDSESAYFSHLKFLKNYPSLSIVKNMRALSAKKILQMLSSHSSFI